MDIKKLFMKLVIAASFSAVTALAQTPYDEGQKALRAQHWMEAARQFAKAAREPGAEDDHVAAAMYWRAHALYRADHRGDAARQVSELERQFPDSRWLAEARALQVEYGGSINDANAEDELRVFALSQLMERDLERALPLLLQIMRETQSDKVRQDALFVLGMSDSPEARQAIAEAARNSEEPELQAQAIQMLGAASTEDTLAMLDGLYASADDQRVKEAIIHAYIAGDRPAPLLAILEAEQDPELQREVIHALGAMGATEALRELYPKLGATETRLAAIEAFAISGDSGMLRQVLETESNPELRRTAIQGIAIHGGEEAAGLLRSLYASTTDHREKLAILESLAILDDAESLALEIVQTERDPELLATAIQILGVMGATGELAGLYQRFDDIGTRRTVLEAMAVAGDGEGLRRALRSEQDPELKAAAIHGLAIDGGDDAGPFLAGLYAESGSQVEKTAIIESMMVLHDAGGLISLLEQEQDPVLRRQMLEVLTMMDTEEANEYLFRLLEAGG